MVRFLKWLSSAAKVPEDSQAFPTEGKPNSGRMHPRAWLIRAGPFRLAAHLPGLRARHLYVSTPTAQVYVYLSEGRHSGELAGKPHRVAAAWAERSKGSVVRHFY
jgi:hypothetical protein